MKAGRALQAMVTLLATGMLVWSTTAQAFSFCFSFASKGSGGAYSNSRYYQSPAAWLPTRMQVMPYSYTPYPGSYYYPESPVIDNAVAPVENQGLDYIMR